MAYEVVMPYHLHMPSYFLETFTEYPYHDHCRLWRYHSRNPFRAFPFGSGDADRLYHHCCSHRNCICINDERTQTQASPEMSALWKRRTRRGSSLLQILRREVGIKETVIPLPIFYHAGQPFGGCNTCPLWWVFSAYKSFCYDWLSWFPVTMGSYSSGWPM